MRGALAGRWATGFILVAVCVGTHAQADSINRDHTDSDRTAFGVARLVYGHVPVLTHPEVWIERQWRLMHARTVRLTEMTARDLRGLRDLRGMSLAEGEFFLTIFPDASFEGAGPVPVADGARGGAVRDLHVPGFAEGLAEFTQADVVKALAEIPEGAIAFVEYVTRFTDLTLFFTLNLGNLFRREVRVDWELIESTQNGLQTRKAALKVGRRREGKDAAITTGRRVRVIEKIARSAFKIFFGLVLGLVLWVLVARAGRSHPS